MWLAFENERGGLIALYSFRNRSVFRMKLSPGQRKGAAKVLNRLGKPTKKKGICLPALKRGNLNCSTPNMRASITSLLRDARGEPMEMTVVTGGVSLVGLLFCGEVECP